MKYPASRQSGSKREICDKIRFPTYSDVLNMTSAIALVPSRLMFRIQTDTTAVHVSMDFRISSKWQRFLRPIITEDKTTGVT